MSFHLTIIHPKRVLFEGDVESLFLTGDRGEFEILSYHCPLISLLKKGNIIINWKKFLPIKKGLARFIQNEMVILVEE